MIALYEKLHGSNGALESLSQLGKDIKKALKNFLRIKYIQRLSQNFQERMALDRPVYSTPPPVESTPQNNECRLVDVHGHKIAAFTINHDEYICLPQVNALFWGK